MVKNTVLKKIGASKLLLFLGGAMAGVKLLKSKKEQKEEQGKKEQHVSDYHGPTASLFGADNGTKNGKSTDGKSSGRKCKKCKCNKCCKAKETKQ